MRIGIVAVLFVSAVLLGVLAFLPAVERWLGNDYGAGSNPIRPSRSTWDRTR